MLARSRIIGEVQNFAPRTPETEDASGKSDLKTVGLKMVEFEK